ncbi:MAG: Peptidyl-prolyl cis-trans isomerase PpiD [Myxococcaceae bacterium]|nr:Peptidyl-prolyl cis-trans isomerase PpiD [Myxococcaceae bacterium]
MGRARTLIALACVLSSSMAEADVATDEARRKQVIVHGDGVDITVGQVEDLIARQAPAMRGKYRDTDELKTLISGLLRTELLANEAQRRGYESELPVRYLTKDSAAQALVRSEIDDKLTPEAIAVEDVSAYYETHPAEFHRVAMRRASQIVLESEAEAERLLPEVSVADARAFAELAKQYSKDPETKTQGGDLGYFASEPANDPPRDKAQPIVQPAVRKAVFALAEVGDTSKQPAALSAPEEAHAPPAEHAATKPPSTVQLAIVRFTAERPERHVSLEDAALSIRAKLWRERRQHALDQLYAKLRAKDKPQVFTERIYQISFDDMEKRPSGFVPDPVRPAAPALVPAANVAAPSAP